MTENTRGGPPSRGGPGGGNRDNRGGGQGRGGGGRGGPHKGGKPGNAKPERIETYESLKELTRGPDFRIDKYVVAEKKSHKPVKTEYRLTREGLNGVHSFSRLVDAQTAATAPLPEPEPEPIEEVVEAVAEPTADIDASETEPVTENEPVESVPEETVGDSVEQIAEGPESNEEAAT